MLGEKIRNLRKQNRISQEELAEKLNVSRQSVSLWENDQTQPSLENIVALAKIFNTSTDDLLCEDLTVTYEANEETTQNTNEKEFNLPSGKKSGWIIGILLFICFTQALHPYLESSLYDYALLLGLIDFTLINLIMMSIPIFIGIIKLNMTPKSIKKICLINSISLFFVFLALHIIEVSPFLIGGLGAFFYYFINKHILLQVNPRIHNKKKALSLTVTIFCALILFLLCGINWVNDHIVNSTVENPSSSIKTTNSENVLVVAIESDFKPFSYQYNQKYYGVHIDIASEMARRLEYDVDFVVVDFTQFIDGVCEGRYDMAFGLEKTPEREKIVQFTDAYYENMCAIYHTEGEKATFDEWYNYKKTLSTMIEDGTVDKILSKYGLY